MVQSVIEVWVIDMNFMWTDSHNRTVFVMKVVDLEYVFPVVDDVVVVFIPPCCCGELWTWDLGNR